MIDPRIIAQVVRFAEEANEPGTVSPTQVPELGVVRHEAASRFDWTVYDPNCCLVLQGRKTAHLGDREVVYGPGEALIVSHTVPIAAAVVEASKSKPYLALILQLDLNIIRELVFEFGDELTSGSEGQVLEAERADEGLIACLVRLFQCSQDPLEAKAVGPMAIREAHFHILRARHAGVLRQMMDKESKASKIALAIAEIKRGFRERLVVTDLAELSGMSASAFYKAFKDITSMTPLQFQKDLRLIEARRLIGFSDKSVSQIAFEVGYLSSSQFSREYSRKFGVSPSLEEKVVL